MSYRDFKGVMRPGQNKRRGRNPNNPGNPNNPNNPNQNPNQQRQRGPHRVQSFDSSGPSVKIRGNAYQVFERYVALAREAALSGDRIAAENLYQHAEHYFRVMNANGEGQGNAPRPMTPADTEMSGLESDSGEQMQHGHPQQDQREFERDHRDTGHRDTGQRETGYRESGPREAGQGDPRHGQPRHHDQAQPESEATVIMQQPEPPDPLG
jgi:hypothetical protein